MKPLTLTALRSVLSGDIEELYGSLGYDYSMEIAHQRSGLFDEERRRFIEGVAFLVSPNHEDIKRVFNQLNTAFAEKATLHRDSTHLGELILAANRLCLWRQGKREGVRQGEIEFGSRHWLPPRDPRRAFKLFRGLTPHLVSDAISAWAGIGTNVQRTQVGALFLTMALITIHPFTDANGRVARIVFTHHLTASHTEPVWLAEDSQGEFARRGEGPDSTPYHMMNVVKDLGGGHNVVPYLAGSRLTSADAEHVFRSFLDSLELARGGNFPASLWELDKHLQDTGQYLSESPRFQCLETLIRAV